jgi:CheY-like chemotaxis protein
MSSALHTPLAALNAVAAQAHELLGHYGLPLLVLFALAVLVVMAATVHSTEPPPLPARPARGEPAVLVVDDSAVARAKLTRLFEGAGYRTEAARDGAEAIEALAKARYNVLVTDLEMPKMNGFELIAWVHGSLDTEDLPIIAITGHDELQARVHQLGGLYGIYKKPWNDRELLERVQALARLRTPPPASAQPRWT